MPLGGIRRSCAPAILLLAWLAASSGLAQEAQPSAPKPQISMEERGDIYMARKMYREAIETYGKIDPPTAASLNKVGIAYQQSSDLALAKKYYERSIKLNPKYAEAINNLGTVYYAQKSYRRATTYYKRALVIQPRSASMLANLGTAWFARHNYAEAQKVYEQALEIDPEVFERRGTHGVVLEERDIAERAKFDFYMAKMYAKRGNTDLALQYIRKALESGFKDVKKFQEEAEFAEVRKLPEFDVIIKQPPKQL